MNKGAAVMRDLLISTIATMCHQSLFQKGPTIGRLLQIEKGFCRKMFLERWRRCDLRQSGYACGCGGGRLWVNDLAIPVIRQNIVFVASVARVNQKIEPSIRILHLCEK